MYGGGNQFLNPGGQQQQYGQQQFPQQTGFGQMVQQPQQQQQQQPLGPQATGYANPQFLTMQHTQQPQMQPQMQPQYTGMPGPGMMQYQQTGIPPVPPLPTGVAPQPIYQQQQQQQPQFQQQQPQFQQQQQQPQQQLTPQATSRPSTAKANVKIPDQRLSFITAADQAKFEQLFKSAVGPGEQALSGEKAKQLLLRSKLNADALSDIWILSDTTKSGQLLFPEFALAMYLCNLKLKGKALPSSLPEVVRNEVSSMVDRISFGIEDPNAPPAAARPAHVPNFEVSVSTPATSTPSQQQSNTSLLSGLQVQPTSFTPQQTGFAPQPTGVTPQQTGFLRPGQLGNSPSMTVPPMPPIPTQPTGMYLGAQPTGMGSLMSQPTGRPGQWGFVNAPATGLPGIDLLQQRMMPQTGREGGFTTAGLQGNANIPWAVTKDEKKIYDNLFEAWDGLGKGFIGGKEALEIFGQSGLDRKDLEQIWNLADPGNKGKLNKDEFSVAMHLIYRKLNGYPVPAQLPPELIPPSSRKFANSVTQVKSMLKSDARNRTASALQAQPTGVSYLKSHSFRSDGAAAQRKDATVYRFNDEDVGYKSSARRRAGGREGRTSSPAQEDDSIETLRKQVREKQILLDAVDIKDERDADNDDNDRRDRRDIDDLQYRIRKIQEEIDRHPTTLKGVVGSDDKKQLKRQLQSLTDRLPELASRVRKTEQEIASAKLELFRLRESKNNPEGNIVGTGPNGEVTEADRRKARSRAMMQKRMAALTGKDSPVPEDNGDFAKKLEEETRKVNAEKSRNEQMIQDIEEGAQDFQSSLEATLREAGAGGLDEERSKWEDGIGVEEEVQKFIAEIRRASEASRPRPKETPSSYASPAASSPAPGRATPTMAPSYGSYKTAEERAEFIRQQAQQRMAERLAALGIKADSNEESPEQKAERQRKERAEKVKRSQEEEKKRAEERRKQAESLGIVPPEVKFQSPEPAPTPVTKKPPPPPTRKGGRVEPPQRDTAAEEEAARLKAEQESRAKAEQEARIREAEEAERRRTEEKMNVGDDLAKRQAAAQARLEALKRDKDRKQQETRQKREAQKKAKEEEARIAAMEAEIKRLEEEERRMQEEEDESSSDEEGPQVLSGRVTPTQESVADTFSFSSSAPPPPAPPPLPPISTPASPPSPPPAPPLPSVKVPTPPIASPAPDATRNPFHKHLQASNGSANGSATSAMSPAVATPEVSHNPFFKSMDAAPVPQATTGGRRVRKQEAEDDWSVVDSDSNNSDDEDMPGRTSTAALATLLFGNMGTPKPLPSKDSEPVSPSPQPIASPVAQPPMPPPAPPLPGAFPGSPPPPPPPPPMPSMGGGFDAGEAPPAPPVGGDTKNALLSQIAMGARLRKVQTKDKSTPATAGRVL